MSRAARCPPATFRRGRSRMRTDQPIVLRGDLTEDLLVELSQAPRVAWDIETTGLDWRTERIGTCQLFAPEVGVVIVQANDEVPDRLRQLLADPAILKVLHHAPFDLRF